MPSGKTHERLQILAVPVLTVSGFFIASVSGIIIGDWEFATGLCIIAAAFAGSTSAIIFTPDLADVDADTLPERRIRSVPILGWFVATVYDGLALLIPHRGISHVPVVGTAVNMLLIWPVLVAWGILFGWCLPIWFFVFKALADLVHITADIIVTGFRRTF